MATFSRVLVGVLRRLPFGSRYLPPTLAFIEKHPKLSLGAVLVLSSPFIDHILQTRVKKRLGGPVLARLESGSKPMPLPYGKYLIECPEMKESLMRLVKVPLTGPEYQRMFARAIRVWKNAIDKEGVQQTQLRSVVS